MINSSIVRYSKTKYFEEQKMAKINVILQLPRCTTDVFIETENRGIEKWSSKHHSKVLPNLKVKLKDLIHKLNS